jgi:hypothetical protein
MNQNVGDGMDIEYILKKTNKINILYKPLKYEVPKSRSPEFFKKFLKKNSKLSGTILNFCPEMFLKSLGLRDFGTSYFNGFFFNWIQA